MAGLKRYNALLLFIFDIETPRHLLQVSMVELIKESADVAIIKVAIGRRPTIRTPSLLRRGYTVSKHGKTYTPNMRFSARVGYTSRLFSQLAKSKKDKFRLVVHRETSVWQFDAEAGDFVLAQVSNTNSKLLCADEVVESAVTSAGFKVAHADNFPPRSNVKELIVVPFFN